MSYNQAIEYNSNNQNNINKKETMTSEQKRQIVDDLFSSDSQLSIQSNDKNLNSENKVFLQNNKLLNPIINNQEKKYINNIINNDNNNNFNDNNNYNNSNNNYNNLENNFNINNHINQQNFNNHFNDNLENNNKNNNDPVKLIDFSFTGNSVKNSSIFSNNQNKDGDKKDDILLDLQEVKFFESFKNQNNDFNSHERNSLNEKEKIQKEELEKERLEKLRQEELEKERIEKIRQEQLEKER